MPNYYQLTMQDDLPSHIGNQALVCLPCDPNQYQAMDNRGLAYADGFFSTMGVYQGKVLWHEYHSKRLLSHSKALQLTLDRTVIIKIMTQVNRLAMHIDEGIIKILITRKPQSVVGYGFNNGEMDVYIKTMPMAMLAYHHLSALPHQPLSSFSSLSIEQILKTHAIPIQPMGEAICLTSQIACLPPSLAGLKSLNRLDSVLVAAELEKAKVENPDIVEGLVADVSNGLLDVINDTADDTKGYPINNNGKNHHDRNWVEGVISNVFYRLGSDTRWYTPPISHSGVDGVMRQVLLDCLAKSEQTVIERRLTDKDLSQSPQKVSAMFFCNAVRGVIPISRLQLLDGHHLSFNQEVF